jgi:UPF0176 protein
MDTPLQLPTKVKNAHLPYRVLLYYCFTPIEDPAALRNEQHALCIELGLRGRIIVAPEGLNGTVSGTIADCQAYMERVSQDPRFKGIDFKVEGVQAHTFRKINVRIKEEIVHAGLPHLKPYQRTGKHLTPAEFKALMQNDPDVVVVDMRSNYEHNLGKFKNAITFEMENFRELPEHLAEIAHLKDKKILTYCTGGIKCEKATALLLEAGFRDVYQLQGGIIKYGAEVGGEDFEGKCYVFDNRIAVDVNQVNPTILTQCYVCGTKSDNMVNCANPTCNRHTVICQTCLDNLDGGCSIECKMHPKKRPYDGTGKYERVSNGYNPEVGFRQQARELRKTGK